MAYCNIPTALKALGLETSTTELSTACTQVGKSLHDKTTTFQEAVNILSEYLLNLDDAKLYRKHLANILLALVSAKIPLKPILTKECIQSCSDAEKITFIKHAVVLATLSDHPDVLQYALKYFEVNNVAPFEVYLNHKESYNVAIKKRRLQASHEVTDKHMVMSCYDLLRRLPNEFSRWDWTRFVNTFSEHDDAEIRWMVKECMVILTNMTEAQSKILSKNLNIPPKTSTEIQTKTKEKPTICTYESEAEIVELKSDNVVNIDGIMLPLYDRGNVQSGNLVPVKSTVNNLRSLALAVASGKALSLMGPVGSGKTSLVEHLAAITGRKGIAFKKVQLGDQTDSRMLLGSHQCTDIPGEFVWRPGVLTEAVQNGHWLLLEDIDSSALDVASTLSSLLERNSLSVPGYRDSLPVTPGFQLFVTQRTLITNFGFQKKMSNSSALLQKHLTQINVEPLSRTELGEIIQVQYPSLTSIVGRMIEVFMMFSVGSHDSSLQTTELVENENKNLVLIRGSRLISTRDLMKWCARAVVDYDVTSPESALKVLQDALDIFTCSVSKPEDRLELAKKIGACLGIVETKSEFYVKHHKPNVALNPDALEVGRAKVKRKEKDLDSLDFDNRQAVFSFTRQSACLLERIACCVNANEPVLLVGETGTGKTSSVQYLAKQTGHKLVVINMNQQSDSADLLGGYKPVDLKYVIKPIRNEFENLFRSFYNVEKNKKFLNHINTCFETENWTALLALIKQSHKAAVNRLNLDKKEVILRKWLTFGTKLVKLEQQVKAASRLTFAFIEGSLVKAMQEGHWVLLDEINLASAEILECLAGLLEDKSESIDLIEKNDKVPIKRHADFTLFACMNPATDVGKKDLPVGLRNRFTEFFIDELTERNDLMLLIGDYLYHMNLSGAILEAIFLFYSSIKKEAKLNLVDGAGTAPHYSLRTLCRALSAAARAACGTVARSLYEAFCLSFLTQLDSSSHPKVEAMIAKAVIGKKNIKSVLNQIIPEPQIRGQNFLLFEGHWIPQGKLEIDIPDGYILTQTVRKNLRDIARIISLGRLPVLLQGDTSVGKTSLITYIAKASGNYCVRINNHEHTDLQEYIGSYATDSNGKLVFKEGVLVEAMRKGYWIILDELNLAPSDVLEALNRVLDDNRELFIPETQQVVKADPNFMLFATQNPPGLYGGRKMLSRAFRNRFVELHFDEIPKSELEIILHQRCHIPPTYSKKMIAVMAELQVRRRGSAAVQGKDGFITLRDLFRWGQRYKLASKTEDTFYDWDQHIADEGYLILAGRVRETNERSIIEEVIEKHIKRKVNPENLFSLHALTSPVTKPILELILNNQLEEFSHVVWTFNMRRLAVLIGKAFNFNEPVLLVGETGCAKTTICQVMAALRSCQLFSVNCHMHTESSDFLGGLRPVRQYKNDGRLFEWQDGPLIKAMENGHMFLADEISLADDSVLERMNSLLEPERQLVLAERGMEDNSDIVVVTAANNFHFIGTMNPGGDFGKKELSPALRNRFTEMWCDSVTSREDMTKILEKSVHNEISLGNQEDGSSGIGNRILDFTEWLKNSEVTNKFPFSIRDLLSWVNFINTTVAKGLLTTPEAYVHGACMTFLDCFGTALTGHIETETLQELRTTAIDFLMEQIKTTGNDYSGLRVLLSGKQSDFVAENDGNRFGIKPFFIEVQERIDEDSKEQFTFTAPTTGANTLRLLRGLQLNKAILLEGNPGVGKTSLVTALAKASGHKVVRINLSDQTDISDLFGTDLPSEDGSFTFKEGAFLSALQNGDWILLDELNLAPQPVLEGLNACLDHRGEVYIPELGKTFKVKAQTRLFACQNPLKQGGARRGLPVSFLNRFTQVYVDTLTKEDLEFIVEAQYGSLPKDILQRIVKFNCKVAHEITVLQTWAHRGSPWEMNLRDIQRWCEALIEDQKNNEKVSPGKFVYMLYINRMRTIEDKTKMSEAYDEVFLPEYPRSDTTPQFNVETNKIIIGDVTVERNEEKAFKNRSALDTNMLILRNQLSTLKALAQSVKMNWLTILVGQTATGKSSIVQVLADLTGNELHVIPVTSAMDVSDLLGGFEQVDYNRNLENIFDKIETLTVQTVRNTWLQNAEKRNKLMSQLHEYKTLQAIDSNVELDKFNKKIQFLLNHCEVLIQNNLKDDATFNKLTEIVQNLKALEAKVVKASTVNAGGKFEWIDSLLVKTMMEGSWLLLDNVNLTSAAVLDRLNGLLEPNGVLSIPERGEASELVPHKNFRVFFTMDPKFGEISRAMRNRGVEVFLLRADEGQVEVTETVPYLDLTALLASCGLPEVYHRKCIECHELMTSFVYGLERPTISHLLQAAHLTWQQITRGVDKHTAIINSFSDVYIKPRCGGDFSSTITVPLAEMKNNMLKALQNSLEEDMNDEAIDTNHTLTVKGLSKDSAHEIAKQISYVATDAEGLNALFNLFTAYQKSTNDTQEILYSILKQKLKNTEKALNETAYKVVQKLGENNYPNKRFYPESNQLADDEIFESNTKSILLYTELKKQLIELSRTENHFSAFDYSKAVLSGTLTDDFVEYPILKYCQYYLQIVDEYIENGLKSIQTLNDQATCRLVQLLNWRYRFIRICGTPIFVSLKNKRTPILKEEIVPLLYMHCKWLQKHLLGELFSLLPPNSCLPEKFSTTTKELILDSEHDNIALAKLGKKIRKVNGQPKLFANEKEHELCLTRAAMYRDITLDLNQPIERQTKKFVDLSIIANVDIAFDVPDEKTLNDVQEYITKAIESTKADQMEIKLLPVTSYISQRVLNALQNHIYDVLNNTGSVFDEKAVKMLQVLVGVAKVTKGFPPELLSLLGELERLQGDELKDCLERLTSLPLKFWTEFHKRTLTSPSHYPLPFLTTKEDIEEAPIDSKRVSSNVPLLPYYVQKLTVSGDIQGHRHTLAYETVSLQDRAEYSILLETILNVVWKNIATLDNAAANKLQSDATFELKKYEEFIKILYTVLHENCETFTEDVASKTVELLRKYLSGNDVIFVDNLKEANRVYTRLKQMSNEKNYKKVTILTGQLSLLTTLVITKVLAEISPVDHVEKYRLKVSYIEEDIKLFDSLLSAYYMHGVVSGSINGGENVQKTEDLQSSMYENGEGRESLVKVHPYCKVVLDLKEQTAARVHKYASGNTFRPKEPCYNSFVKDCKHFTKSVLAPKTASDIVRNLISTTDKLQDSLDQGKPNREIIRNAQIVSRETSSWLFSITAFSKKIDTSYSETFPDLAKPLQCSLTQIAASVTSLNDVIKEYIVKLERGSVKEAVKDIMTYPVAPSSGIERHLNRFLTSSFQGLLDRIGDENAFSIDVERLEVLKMNLTELKMHCYATEEVDRRSYDVITHTLDNIVEAWGKQLRDIEQKKIDDEALYVTKSKCEDLDEEQQDLMEISEMFPSFSDQDFVDFKTNDLEQKPEPKPIQKSNLLITSEDVSLVYNWHSKFVRNMTCAEWLPLPKKKPGIDAVSSLIERYPTFSRVIQECWEVLDAENEAVLNPTMMVLIAQIKAKVDGDDTSPSKPDFYRSPCVSETRQCFPLLLKVKESVNVLLDQWPDFPTLKDIMVIVNRILSFPVTSPISRFLTGLELLRDKIEEWNKHAHKGNNLIDISLNVGQQIINWRKLEMANWKECLNNLYQRKQAEAHKYWFHVYSVVQSYLSSPSEDATPSKDASPSRAASSPSRVSSVLRDFMEKSTLVEYEARLDIVYVFHCHLVLLPQSERRDELISILWNTYTYYGQFTPGVAATLKEKRAPVEKKLKDFVKICSWDRDLSYWSVKDTVSKAHKALHKHTKEFENILKEPVLPCLVDKSADVASDHVGIWDRPKRASIAPNNSPGGAYMIDVSNFVVQARNMKKYLDQAEQASPLISEGSLLSRVPALLNKARALSKDALAHTGYPALVQALDDFVTTLIETANHLGGLEVEASAPKEKQKSQAKNILQQKRKAIADLFRYLAKMGLNYRAGLVTLAAGEDLEDPKIPPLDLEAMLGFLKTRRCDVSLSLLWSGCSQYFVKSLSRRRRLHAALLTPHGDLGLQNVERCKGYAAQLLKIATSQKRSLSKYSRHLCDLRTLTSNLTSALEVTTDSNLTNLPSKLTILTEAYGHASIVLEQFIVLINSFPEKVLTKEYVPEFDTTLTESPIVRCYKNSDEWKKLHAKVKSIIAYVNKLKAALAKLRNSTPNVIGRESNPVPLTQNCVDVTQDAFDNLDNMRVDIESLIDDHKLHFNDRKVDHPILRSIACLLQYTEDKITELEDLDQTDVEMDDTVDEKELVNQSEDLIATMLLIIQSVYKRHQPEMKSSSSLLDAIDEIIDDGDKNKSESKEILEDNHLKELLQEKLSTDLKLLQIEALNNKIGGLLQNYINLISLKKESVEVRNALMRLVPILEQTVLFVQYFVTQKVAVHRVSCKMLSVLLKIFADLTTKGFCKPSDMDMEDGDGGPGSTSAGAGLGEGEGQTDVSDKIENQDQLDDATRPGEEKKEEDRDCKEEEKGVNMTDDFDSHLQDVDKKEGEESDQEDEDDADKQMGDIENAADKLDQQIWGSEDEEEQEEQSKKEKEDKGTGESTGEKEMAAKEEEEGKDDGDKGKERKEKKDINEMEEPEIDDDHVDPYHGNQQPMPEPEDFEMPDNMDLDGEDPADDKEGETETENPFDLDVMKENMVEEEENKKEDKKNDEGLEVSSDEEDGKDGDDQETKDKEDELLKDDQDNQGPEDEKDQSEDKEQTEDKKEDEDKDQNGQDATIDDEPEESQEPETKEDEDLPRNPEKPDDEDKVEEVDDKKANPQANPSNDDQADGEKAENAEMEMGTDDNVETNADQAKDDDAAPFEQKQEQVGDERQAAGRSEMDSSEQGHRGPREVASRAAGDHGGRENKPGDTDQERTLGDVNEKKHKQARTLNIEQEEGEEEGGGEEEQQQADAYQHVKEAKRDDMQAVDAATKEQAEQQPTLKKDDEEAEELKEDDVAMDVDDDDIQIEKAEKELAPEKLQDKTEKDKEKPGKKKEGSDEPTGDTGVEVDGENVVTATVPRGNESTYHTRLPDATHEELPEMSIEQYMSLREFISAGASAPSGMAAGLWRGLWGSAAGAARGLAERLRLLLEPTGRSRRAGDFRTGRAINMRRVIPYIASHFRKDRIWLRRTKPAKREYKIAIAVDDSSSMSDNRSKELAFESLALVSQALNLIESGDLAVLSFGEQTHLLHPFSEQFTEHSGAKILEKLRFDQNKTKIAQLLDFSSVMFEQQSMNSDAFNAKLLVIVSDGRGIFSEGETRVTQAVRGARQKGIFLVYVIIDNPDNKDSIMDIRRPLFDAAGGLGGFVPYLDSFPFPFYLILRDMSALPMVLGDALRQWFELAANTS